MTTPTENVNEIIQYLKSLRLPEDEITYPPELASIIVERVVHQLQKTIDGQAEELQQLYATVTDLVREADEYVGTIEDYENMMSEIQEIIA